MKKVYISPGCISCGTCEAICPEVFEVKDISQIKPNVDINKYETLIKEASDICPVQSIKIE
ncbi:MAG: 4Fe-4S binding domain protein [candidate division TM6 bacterium GW2011_GWF2_37_49]|nr:MAG: 4Fe-4S binding domain protein [candidate division TM6 bacterium GW2011_GWF2_37_49]